MLQPIFMGGGPIYLIASPFRWALAPTTTACDCSFNWTWADEVVCLGTSCDDSMIHHGLVGVSMRMSLVGGLGEKPEFLYTIRAGYGPRCDIDASRLTGIRERSVRPYGPWRSGGTMESATVVTGTANTGIYSGIERSGWIQTSKGPVVRRALNYRWCRVHSFTLI